MCKPCEDTNIPKKKKRKRKIGVKKKKDQAVNSSIIPSTTILDSTPIQIIPLPASTVAPTIVQTTNGDENIEELQDELSEV